MTDEPQRYLGYTLQEAAAAAVDCGTLAAWEWFKAWYTADVHNEQDEQDIKAGPRAWDY